MKSRQSNAGGRHHVQERSLGRKLQRLEADVQREEDYIDRIKKKIKELAYWQRLEHALVFQVNSQLM